MTDRSRLRLFVMQVLVLSLLATLLGRLWFLQVVTGSEYSAAAESNRVREVVTQAARGMILDDVGRPLVRNRTALVVSVNRSLLPRPKEERAAVLTRLAEVIGMPLPDLQTRITLCGPGAGKGCYNGSPYQPVPVKEDASPAMALKIEEHRELFAGVTAQFEAVREFPARTGLAAHLLGYLSAVSQTELDATKDPERLRNALVGRAGLEAQYDDYLRGRTGVKQVSVDHTGNVTGVLSETAPAPGKDVVLNIDAGVQQATEDALAAAVDLARTRKEKNGPLAGQNYKADSGAAVVLDADTGAVVAMASYPSYDPSVWVGGISQADFTNLTGTASGEPLTNRATQGQYAPGSTFKLITSAASVQDGYPLNGIYPCPGSFQIGNSQKKNFEGEVLGNITLRTALIKSCDTIFYKFGVEQWQRDLSALAAGGKATEPMANMARAFGFGTATGIDLPGERSGRVADRAWKEAYWEATKDNLCKAAESGYPEVAKTDPTRAAYLQQIARENCTDGAYYRGGDAANFSVGQGDMLVTPLQLASAYAAIANGGTLYQPQLAKAVVGAGGEVVKEFAPIKTGTLPVDKATQDYIRSALMEVTGPDGTARTAYGSFPRGDIPIGGKTGTAEVAGKFDTSWFASFSEKPGSPRYVVVGMVTQAGTGGTVAAPMTRSIFEALYGVGREPVSPAPGGNLPASLPTVLTDGTVSAPAGTFLAAQQAAEAAARTAAARPDTASVPAPSGTVPAPDPTATAYVPQRRPLVERPRTGPGPSA